MQLSRVFTLLVLSVLVVGHVRSAPSPQEPAFELPVQLFGFPLIITAVRLTNFVKKLSYALNPQTYVARSKRSAHYYDEEILDIGQVEKKLVEELGQGVCIYERVCARHADVALRRGHRQENIDWNELFSHYKASPDPMKENYLLSVFLGEIVASPRLCHQLAKRGRVCKDQLFD